MVCRDALLTETVAGEAGNSEHFHTTWGEEITGTIELLWHPPLSLFSPWSTTLVNTGKQGHKGASYILHTPKQVWV
jgi:hypothetical protein